MAEADPLQRIKYAARRSEGPVSVETQRRRYLEELDQDLGLDAITKHQRTRAARPSRFPSVGRIVTYLMIFTMALIIAMTVRLWHDGVIGRLITAHLPHAPTETGWMAKRDEGTSKADLKSTEASEPLPSFIDPLPTPPAAPAASQPDDSGDPSESQDDSSAQ